jgi:hypothetical protein
MKAGLGGSKIRSIYDTCRKDGENIKLKKDGSKTELTALGGGGGGDCRYLIMKSAGTAAASTTATDL